MSIRRLALRNVTNNEKHTKRTNDGTKENGMRKVENGPVKRISIGGMREEKCTRGSSVNSSKRETKEKMKCSLIDDKTSHNDIGGGNSLYKIKENKNVKNPYKSDGFKEQREEEHSAEHEENKAIKNNKIIEIDELRKHEKVKQNKKEQINKSDEHKEPRKNKHLNVLEENRQFKSIKKHKYNNPELAPYYRNLISTPNCLHTGTNTKCSHDRVFPLSSRHRAILTMISLDQRHDLRMEHHYRDDMVERWIKEHRAFYLGKKNHKRINDSEGNSSEKCKQNSSDNTKLDSFSNSRIDSSSGYKTDSSGNFRVHISINTKPDSSTYTKPDSSGNSKPDTSTYTKPDCSSNSKPDSSTNTKADTSTYTKPDCSSNSKPDSSTNTKPDSSNTDDSHSSYTPIIPKDYMEYQPELTWADRDSLVSYIHNLSQHLVLTDESLYLSIHLIDLFLSKRVVSKKKLEMVGRCALFIAAKYEEKESPSIKQFLVDNNSKEISYREYRTNSHINDRTDCFNAIVPDPLLNTRSSAHIPAQLDKCPAPMLHIHQNDLIRAERYFLVTLSFNLNYSQPLEVVRVVNSLLFYNYRIRVLSKYLLECTLIDHKFIKHGWLIRALASCYLSIKMVNQRNDGLMYQVFKVEKGELSNCVSDLLTMIRDMAQPSSRLGCLNKKDVKNPSCSSSGEKEKCSDGESVFHNSKISLNSTNLNYPSLFTHIKRKYSSSRHLRVALFVEEFGIKHLMRK